jgi:flavin reductase (DIM6/NTAB) family NADH-FMN oxidoreductase RutF
MMDDDSWQSLITDDGVHLPLLRRAFSRFPTGVAAIAAVVGGENYVLVVSSFQVGISADPPLALFSVQQSSSTWPELRKAEYLGVSVLAEHQGDLCQKLATKGSDRFASLEYEIAPSDAIYFPEAALQLQCRVLKRQPAGDHELVIIEVVSTQMSSDRMPLVFHEAAYKSIATPV